MSRFVFKLPDVGEGTAEAEIVAWHVAVGDTVHEDQNLVDVMTDKATVEITSPVTGKVIALHGEPGETAQVGSPLAELEIEEEGAAAEAENVSAHPAAAEEEEEEEEGSEAAIAPELPSKREPASGNKPLASPVVRKRALDLGIDLQKVHGTSPEGRITHADLDAFISSGSVSAAPRALPREGVEDVKVIGLRRKIAEKMQDSKRRIPHYAYIDEIDMTELESLRAHLNETRSGNLPKLTVLPFFVRALVRALPDFPQINARFDDEAGVVHRYAAIHVGIATQTANGLIVPVLRHAETRDVWNMAAEIARLAQLARDGKASREELSGSTITITSLGALGGLATTPVINHPEVAIIGPNAIMERPVVKGGQIVVRKMMNLSSSFDHRVVDGHDAARFIQRLKAMLEHPATLFMD